MVKSFYYFLRLIFLQRGLILSMAGREVANRYVGSLLGFIWTFVNPVMMILVFWVVFGLGFRVQPTSGVPFVVWLTAGMSAWFLFADIVSNSSGLIISNANLIKKTIFHSQILPIVNIVSCLITHSIFVVITAVLIAVHGLPFSLYYFQFLYYLFGLSVLALGLAWLISALNPFIRDVGQIVAVLLQIGFWSTPIFWDIRIMPPVLQQFLKLNPMFYIVQGYRESFIYFSPFWGHPIQTLVFWGESASMFLIGALVFKKLKPHFPDVL